MGSASMEPSSKGVGILPMRKQRLSFVALPLGTNCLTAEIAGYVSFAYAELSISLKDEFGELRHLFRILNNASGHLVLS